VGLFTNGVPQPAEGQAPTVPERCGPYLAQRMKQLGYRTFGIGKFHSQPRFEDLGYEVHLHSEEGYGSMAQRERDAYARWIHDEHPEYAWVEQLMGERTEMYYQPQMSPLPPEYGVERWAADRAVEQLASADERPFFGLVSFIGPHPPLAPPLPFNRMYDPDRMPSPIKGDLETDHMDEQIPWMNDIIWAENIPDEQARILRARYYGELTYIDDCLGRILDAVEARPDADNTLICFFSDHGDHLGDHHAWQKESFFEQSCHIPFLLSWPAQLPADVQNDEFVCLTDLFGIATSAAGQPELRDGMHVLGMLRGQARPRECYVGYYGKPGTRVFKVMVRQGPWKYIYIANGGREQLFHLQEDPHELQNRADSEPASTAGLREIARNACDAPGCRAALVNGKLRAFPYEKWQRKRVYQFAGSHGVKGFPEDPAELLAAWKAGEV